MVDESLPHLRIEAPNDELSCATTPDHFGHLPVEQRPDVSSQAISRSDSSNDMLSGIRGGRVTLFDAF